MKKIVFTEEFCQPENLFPFTLTRQIQDIRVGILTIREKWEQWLGIESFDKMEGDYKDLERSFHLDQIDDGDLIYLIHGNIIPSAKLVRMVRKLKSGECISVPEKESIVYCISREDVLEPNKIRVKKAIEFVGEFKEIKFPWDITQLNSWAIEQDFLLLAQERKSQKISSTNKMVRSEHVFIEKGAVAEHCILNATEGPIYIGKKAVLMEECMLNTI